MELEKKLVLHTENSGANVWDKWKKVDPQTESHDTDILWSKGEWTHVNSHFPNFFLSGDFFLEEKQTEPDYLTWLSFFIFKSVFKNTYHIQPLLWIIFQLIEKIKILWYRVATKETVFSKNTFTYYVRSFDFDDTRKSMFQTKRTWCCRITSYLNITEISTSHCQ